MSRYSRYQVIHYPQPKVYKPLKVMMKLIVWDTSTSISLKLPHRGKTLDIEYNLIGEYGYAIKQIKYEILDYGDAPKNAVAA